MYNFFNYKYNNVSSIANQARYLWQGVFFKHHSEKWI